MPDATTFGIFVVAALALTIVPGPVVFYIIARSVRGGRRAGLVSALGAGSGGLVHVAFAAVGLSALLASSAAAFAVVKWLGVAYLVWLGLKSLFARDARDHGPASTDIAPEPLWRVFYQGALIQVLNPKTALFFLAFLPQFVEPSRGPAWAQVTILGGALVFIAACTDSLYALLSGTLGDWLKRKNTSARFRRGQRYISGGTYIALGAAAAASGSGKN